MLSVGKVAVLLAGLLQYLAKNMVILVKKLVEKKELSKSVFGYFKTKKA